ncbi:MAG: hypothetical protein AYK19_03605 [Theionarchaea archaeon DG-70-1]|nr:MAG: hypothetical protein AYK19_03605 [Theionarchaea archaeon DG-70-1]
MCLMVRTLYKFNTVETFEKAVQTVESQWKTKFIRGKVIYKNTKTELRWNNLREQLQKAKSVNPETIHGFIAVENQ